MKQPALVLLVATFVLGGAAGTNEQGSSTVSASIENAIAELDVDRIPNLNAGGCIACKMCGTGPEGPHDMLPQGMLMPYPEPEHYGVCEPTWCMEAHFFDEECPGEKLTAEETGALWKIATGGSQEAVIGALQLYPDWIKLNPEHSSLQLYNCVGEIAASIPIHPGRIAEFQAGLAK